MGQTKRQNNDWFKFFINVNHYRMIFVGMATSQTCKKVYLALDSAKTVRVVPKWWCPF